MKTDIKLRRLIIIAALCSLVAAGGRAQKQKPRNQPYADMKWYHLGFHIGLHTQDLILANSGIATPGGETWFAEIPAYSPGFSVGVLGDLYLNPYFSLRLSPTVHFGDKQFTFVEQSSKEKFLTSIRSNYLVVPLDVKYAAVRLNNYRPYLIGGVYTAFDIGRKRGNPLLLKGNDYGVEFGFGCDIYLPFFKLCPEIKFCFGLADVLEKDRNDLMSEDDRKYSQALSRATSRMIVFTFNFE
jgi:hypothetical protein